MTSITNFRGAYDFLSNFYPCQVKLDNLTFPTVEHAFQAAKTHDPADRTRIKNLATPGEAKRVGRIVTLRPDWEEVKDTLMLEFLRQKFAPGSELAEKLLHTGDAKLIEGNVWHDNYWGVCSCSRCQARPGKNVLGKLLMQVREELQNAAS